MNGSRAKKLRRLAYGPRNEWTLDGYFPCHPRVRSYVIMTTYQTMVPRLIEASKDEDKSEPISILPGADGVLYHYRYVPFTTNGRFETDPERKLYQWAKRNWKRFRIESTLEEGPK